MQIVYGTKNTAKLASMQKCLHGLVEVIGLHQTNYAFPDIPEDGNDPLSNARIKAAAYYDVIKQPVFSCDSGLYFENLPEHLQPGLNIRRVNGRRLNDEEMIEYYARLARDHGGRLVARYVNGICLVMGKDLTFEHMGDDIATVKFILASAPHEKRVEGFPLDSLSVHILSGRYYFDLPEERDKEEAWHTNKGFREFFTSAIRRYGDFFRTPSTCSTRMSSNI